MYLVTGGAGFIGSTIVWMLNRRGIDDIIIVDRLGEASCKWRNLVGLRFADVWHESELTARLLNAEMDYRGLRDVHTVIHMGACSSTTEPDADYLLDNNYEFSVQLGQWAIDAGKRMIYASSAAVYGDGAHGFDDDAALTPRYRPLNMYGYSKQLFDLYALRHGWLSHMVGLRFFNVFGPNEYHKGPMRSMIYKAVGQVHQHGTISLFKSNEARFADGDQVRDFLYVKDAVEIVGQLLDNPHVAGTFNIGSGVANTWNALARGVFAAMDKPADIRYIDMPAELHGGYQNYTLASMASLQAQGIDCTCRPFADAIHDYVTGYLLGHGAPCHLDSARDA